MYRIKYIVKDNNSTFYDFKTGQRKSIKGRISIEVAVAGFLALLYPKISSELLNNVIAAQAILLGFSFNIMFFLLSADKLRASQTRSSLEQELKVEKLAKLSEEVFYNISYFIVIGMFCLAVALMLLLVLMEIKPGPFVEFLLSLAGKWEAIMRTARVFIGERLSDALRIAFFFFLFEGAYTFARTVGRVNYLFEQKMVGRNK